MTGRRAGDRAEESTRLVVRALRHALERGRFSVEDAAEIAMVQLMRPGGPAKKLGVTQRAGLRDVVTRFARAIHDLTQPRELLQFARNCSDAAWTLATTPRHPGARMDEAVDGSLRTLARAALYAEATRAKDSEDHVRRAVARAVRERKKSRGVAKLPLDDGDPLRALLDVPARGKVALPRNDVRMRIAGAARNTPFGEVLRRAARFSEEVVRPAVGEELWSLCRPVGFADRAETRVLVEVRSTLLAHEVQLRSQELVHRLKKVPSFASVGAVKIVVVTPAAVPVLR